MPLNPADPAYLSFEQEALPVAEERGIGHPGHQKHGQRGPASAMYTCATA